MFLNVEQSPPDMFLRKGFLKIYEQFYRRTPMQNNLIEIKFRHGCPLVILRDTFKVPFPKNNSGGLLENVIFEIAL